MNEINDTIGLCGHESCDCRSYCKKQQPAPVQEPKFVRMIDGVPCIPLEEHKHLMATQPAAQPSVPEGWQPIGTAPKTSKAILVHCADRKNTFTVTWARDEEFPWSGKWKHFAGDFLTETPTHWMPIPAAPEKG
jgi:hypothetical protein